MIDRDANRLEVARTFGGTGYIDIGRSDAVAETMKLTQGAGVHCSIEAVGVPKTFELGQSIVAAGGTIANVGVHGVKADLHLEALRDRNITITTRLVDTVRTPMLLKTVQSGRLDPNKLITHRFRLADIMNAYETFGQAADTHALKVIIEASG
jgi:alcohol dehydrogenase